MKRHYYYLVAGLQDITIDTHKLLFNQLSLREELRHAVHADDFKLIQKIFLEFDNENVLNILLKNGKPFNTKGNFPQDHIEEQIKEPLDLPAYMNRFIAAFKSQEPVYPELSPENELTTLFYDEMLRENNTFLREWFSFDLNVRNILTALMARKHKINAEKQIIGTSEISEAIRRSHARDFGLGSEVYYLETLTEISRSDDIQEREKSVDMLRWDYLEEASFFEYFTIEKILAYLIKLGLVERWLAIDKDFGSELFNKLLKELQGSYSLPSTFTEK